MAREVKTIDARTLSGWMESGDVVLVDVRPPDRHGAERIEAAVSIPLSSLDPGALPALDGRRLVFHCEIGVASERAARRVLEHGFAGEVHHLGGGISAWKREGLPVSGPCAGRMSLQRQVQVASGALVLLGVALGFFVSPWLHLVAAFVGAGSIYAGARGTCPMAGLLAKLPYNRGAAA